VCVFFGFWEFSHPKIAKLLLVCWKQYAHCRVEKQCFKTRKLFFSMMEFGIRNSGNLFGGFNFSAHFCSQQRSCFSRLKAACWCMRILLKEEAKVALLFFF